ncbi:MAG: hypothetical protein K1X61_10125 [Chitinophagales bacterium]|nr:hypothetical protein [Chitinophagales bacterium]
MNERNRIRKAIPALVMIACFFIGTTTGYLTNDLAAGILIGSGTGLIIMSILRMVMKRKKKTPAEDANSADE